MVGWALSSSLPEMGNQLSIPWNSPLGCILRHWKNIDPQVLKWNCPLFFYNAWSQCILGDGLFYPTSGLLGKNTILQLDLLCRRLGRWSAVTHIQALMALCMNPGIDHKIQRHLLL
jgi:hypothetical protein